MLPRALCNCGGVAARARARVVPWQLRSCAAPRMGQGKKRAAPETPVPVRDDCERAVQARRSLQAAWEALDEASKESVVAMGEAQAAARRKVIAAATLTEQCESKLKILYVQLVQARGSLQAAGEALDKASKESAVAMGEAQAADRRKVIAAATLTEQCERELKSLSEKPVSEEGVSQLIERIGTMSKSANMLAKEAPVVLAKGQSTSVKNTLTIVVCDETGLETWFKVIPSTKMWRVMDEFCRLNDVKKKLAHFFAPDGKRACIDYTDSR